MKIAVMGAGAVGCYYGAKMAMAGHDVTLIGRSGLVQAVEADGLILEMGGARHVCPAQATSDPAVVKEADMVLFCVKSGDTVAAGAQIAPYLRPDAYLLSLQNGVSNLEELQRVTDHPVIAAVVYMASGMVAPGVVRHEGRGDLAIGGTGAKDVAKVLNAAGVETVVSEDVLGLLWGKLIVNCAYNAISAITRQPYGEFAGQAGAMDFVEDVMSECLAVAKAEGVTVPDSTQETVRGVPGWMPLQYSSTAQDVMRGRATEIDYLNGEIVRRAALHGIEVPLNRTLTLLTKLVEPK